MPETYPQGSPLWWLQRLEKQLDARLPEIERCEAYYEGRHRLAFATSKFREAFGALFSAFSDNWCDLVVDASVERLKVQGFRFPGEAGEAGESQGDDEAWRIWQENGMDAESVIAHTEAVKCGESYLLVGPGETGPIITVEHPSQVVVATAPGNRRKRLASLKRWIEDDGHVMGTLYLPTEVYKFKSEQKYRVDEGFPFGQTVRWVQRDDRTESIPNPLGAVPVVPLCNNPSLLKGGRSDLAQVIPVQDAVNKLVADMIIASEYAAFRQRWATGVEIPLHPETHQPMTEQYISSISRMVHVPDDKAKFGEFQASDLGNYVKGIEMLIQHVAAQTRTPPHYLLGQSGAFPSGESLKSTETGLVAKVKRKQLPFGEGYEEAMRLAFALMGDERRSKDQMAETIWADPEARSEGELVDALLKMQTLGVPDEALWERWGASPQEIKRWKAMKDTEPPPPAMPANTLLAMNGSTPEVAPV